MPKTIRWPLKHPGGREATLHIEPDEQKRTEQYQDDNRRCQRTYKPPKRVFKKLRHTHGHERPGGTDEQKRDQGFGRKIHAPNLDAPSLPANPFPTALFRATPWRMRLENKTAIVTGGGSGFGAGIARAFAREGARVMVADINMDAARSIATEIGGTAHEVDVASGDSVKAMSEAAMKGWGRIDILVNNAGITHLPTPLEDVSENDFDRVLAVNAKSVYLTAREIVPHMKSAGKGAILNVASTAGVSPRPRLNWYNASKGWMITATRTMAVELAPAGIRVNALAPVAGETRSSRASSAKTRPRCAPSSSPRSPSAASRPPKTWAPPPSTSAPTRPA